MDIGTVSGIKSMLRTSCMDDIYKPVFDYIVDKLLPEFDKVQGLNTAWFEIRKMLMTDYVSSILPKQIYSLHQWELTLMTVLSDVSVLENNYDPKKHFVMSGDLVETKYGEELSKFFNDVKYTADIIRDIEGSFVHRSGWHKGNMYGKLLHDIDLLTKLEELPPLFKYLCDVSKGKDEEEKIHNGYLLAKTRYGAQGNQKLYMTALCNIQDFDDLVTRAKKTLFSEEQFRNELNKEKGQP